MCCLPVTATTDFLAPDILNKCGRAVPVHFQRPVGPASHYPALFPVLAVLLRTTLVPWMACTETLRRRNGTRSRTDFGARRDSRWPLAARSFIQARAMTCRKSALALSPPPG